MRKKTGWIPLAALLCILHGPVACGDPWDSVALPFAPEIGSGFGFAVDSSGNAGFTFRSTAGSGGDGLYYGYGSVLDGWQTSLVQAGVGTGSGSSLVYYDTTPHISYANGDTAGSGVNYATGGPGAWSTTVIAPNSGRPRHTTIGLDSNNRPAVGWVDQGSSTSFGDEFVGFAYHNGTSWSAPETVASTPLPLVSGGVSLLLPGGADQAQLLYAEEPFLGFPTPPVHAERSTDGTWTKNSGLDGEAASVYSVYLSGALNSSGHPVLAYYTNFNLGTGQDSIYYAEFDGTVWEANPVVDAIPAQTSYGDRHRLDIACDQWGNTHMIYVNPDQPETQVLNDSQVVYRFRSAGGDWSNEIIIYEGSASWLDLEVDDTGTPWYSYVSDTDGQNIAYYGHGLAVPEPASVFLAATCLISTLGIIRKKRAGRE